MTTLVTGATGFIGSALVRALLSRGESVRALARPNHDTSSLEATGVDVRHGDLTRPETLQGLCTGVDTVIHCAARMKHWGTHKQFHEAIFMATQNLLREADGRARKFVYLSSIAALGMGGHLKGALESQAPRHTGIPYGDAKADAEQLVRGYHEEAKLDGIIIRPASVLGSGSVWVRMIVDAMLSRSGIPLIDGGRYSASFVYIDSLVDGILRAASNPLAVGKTYHFRDDWRVSWRQYLTDLGSLIGKKPRGDVPFGVAWAAGLLMEKLCTPLHVRPLSTRLVAVCMGRDNDVDTRQATSELGWATSVPYDVAMERIGSWVRENYGASSAKGSASLIAAS